MKTISLSVSESDYQDFRQAAKAQNRSIAGLIRDAMALYKTERLQRRTPLQEIPVLPGHRPTGELPGRSEIYDEISDRRNRTL